MTLYCIVFNVIVYEGGVLYMVFPNLLSLSKTHDNVGVPYRKLYQLCGIGNKCGESNICVTLSFIADILYIPPLHQI